MTCFGLAFEASHPARKHTQKVIEPRWGLNLADTCQCPRQASSVILKLLRVSISDGSHRLNDFPELLGDRVGGQVVLPPVRRKPLSGAAFCHFRSPF